MKINEEQSLGTLDKALSVSLQNGFEMENMDYTLVERTFSKPRLLTALLGGMENESYIETNTIKYDELEDTIQLPASKTFEAFGPDLKKDKAKQKIFEIGSTGLRYNVAPKDYANKRQPGTNELMNEEYVVAQMAKKAVTSWDLWREIEFATMLTSDLNYVTNSAIVPQYNFYTDIYGGARGAKVDMNLAGAVDHFALFGNVYDTLQEELDKAMSTMNRAVIICGKNFYNTRLEIEKQEGLARDLRSTLDLASMDVPRDNFGSGSGVFGYQYFDSHDGFTYIRYSANIVGSNMIGDNDAYVVPVGSDKLFKRVYAPAQDRENVNTTAQKAYTWSKVDNRTGVHVAQESNSILMNINPKLIIPLTAG